ncbi:MAG: nucleoside phosphorylase [Flavobacteriales bacterium]|nr:nucleoside phosphorylase [Flavobacteriales bacterium]
MAYQYEPSELIINSNGSVYHINLSPDNIADNVIVVGDQNRVSRVSKFFDKIEFQTQKREFITHTGTYKGTRFTVLSTGIGTDNIDIVLNELDAAVNIDLNKREDLQNKRSLNIIRIGTSGALQGEIPVDSFVLSEFGLGFDNVLWFYQNQFNEQENQILEAFVKQAQLPKHISPYLAQGNSELINKLQGECFKGITATASGFYGPQGRQLRLPIAIPQLNDILTNFDFDGHRVTNFEMETSALYGLGGLLGHKCVTVCAIIANRIRKEFSKDYKQTVDELIQYVLDSLVD